MSPKRSGMKWAASVAKHVEDKFGIRAVIEQSKHVRVTFSAPGDSGERRSFLWVTASTPGDRKSRVICLSDLRRGLRQEFGIESIRGLGEFPMQVFVTTELYEQGLEAEWDRFFDGLLSLS